MLFESSGVKGFDLGCSARRACRGGREASLNTLHKLNAEDASLIGRAEAIANGVPVLEAAGSDSILSGSAFAPNAGLAVAPATPALALVH